MQKKGYFAVLVDALLGRSPEPLPAADAPRVEPPKPPETVAARSEDLLEWQSRCAALQLDLKEKEEKITALRREYETLEASRQKAAAEAAREQMEKLFKRLAGTLSNLDVLMAAARAGREVAMEDLIALSMALEKDLARVGMERIGAPGETVAFSSSLHQRMSGAAIGEGAQVNIRVPGYRYGERILLKALITSSKPEESIAEEENHE